ncbi:MAG: hypothetical protein MI754_06900 [Chromatiales bacterium]|nr:hypothetical protein [Chromatiales bacterium]
MVEHTIEPDLDAVNLGRLKKQRDSLLKMHESLLLQAQRALHNSVPLPAPSVASPEEIMCQLKEARELITRQEQRIQELLDLQQNYDALKRDHQVLEETNGRLMAFLMRQEEQLNEQNEIQKVLEAQQDTLAKSKRRIHELENKNKSYLHRLSSLEDDNRRLKDKLVALRKQLKPLLAQQEKNRQDLSRLRSMLRKKEMDLIEAHQAYEDMSMEYEAMYKNSLETNRR